MGKNRDLIMLLSLSILIFIFSMVNYKKISKTESQKPVQQDITVGCRGNNLEGNIDYSQKTAVFENNEVAIPKLAYDVSTSNVLGLSREERWIEVDLSEQKLKAWEGDSVFLETSVSSGLPYFPTPTGTFRIWTKMRATKMEGGTGAYYYYLPNVPYVMFFENENVPGFKGYGLHGTYWHNSFGTPRSHGCVNLPTEIAKELYFWTGPVVPEGKWMTNADPENPGTRIEIHE
jgi:lipoprotein-anchoring transpeptidase ErfK/SrfK